VDVAEQPASPSPPESAGGDQARSARSTPVPAIMPLTQAPDDPGPDHVGLDGDETQSTSPPRSIRHGF